MANWLQRVFYKNEEIDWMYDLDLLKDTSDRAYLKQLAIQICVNHIADTISQSEFKVNSGDTKDKQAYSRHIEYLLNKRPNRNQNASQFWQQAIYQLINDNEVLIIQTDSEELVIADSFEKVTYAFYDYQFKQVEVDSHTFSRNFYMSEVFYMEYSNGQMTQILDGLFSDYGEIFGRLVQYQLYSHQIRATFKLGAIGRKGTEARDKYQSFVDKVTKQFNESGVAIVPLQDGHEYNEHTTGTAAQKSVDEVSRALNGFIDKVAMALRIPRNLLYGDMVDTKEASRNYLKFCIHPLIKQMSDEFSSKLFERRDIEENEYGLEIIPMSLENIFERAESIDKLISSSAYTPNEIRIKAGDKPSSDPRMDEHIRTKNYDTLDRAEGNSSKGGDNE